LSGFFLAKEEKKDGEVDDHVGKLLSNEIVDRIRD